MTVSSHRPDTEALVQCARSFARALEVNPLSDAAARSVIEDVLFGPKDGWAVYQSGLLTREELMNLLLAHLHTELVSAFRQYPEGDPWERPELREAFRKALFDS